MKEKTRKIRLTVMQLIVLIALCANIGIFGCITTGMWGAGDHGVVKNVVSNTESQRISVMILDNERIAVLTRNVPENSMNNLASIYKFKSGSYNEIKPKIEEVIINENITLSSKEKTVVGHIMNFSIHLSGNQWVQPEFVDITMTNRSDHEIDFDDKRIRFKRVVYAEDRHADFSWLWKLPLTPVTVVVDAATTVVGVSVVVAAAIVVAPVLLLEDLVKHN